jgi:hypothetical protein
MAERISGPERKMHITFYQNGELAFSANWPFGTGKFALAPFVPKANCRALTRYIPKRTKKNG